MLLKNIESNILSVSKVTVLTPSYPRYPGDYHGVFIKTLCDNMASHIRLEVIAPRTRTMKPIHKEYPVKLFPYMPTSKMEYIGEETMKNAPRGRLMALPAYLVSAYLKTVEARSDLIHTHLAIPLGLMAALNPKKTPQLITCHGSDITYPIENPVYRPLLRHTLRKADQIAPVSKYIESLAVKMGANPNKIKTIYLGVDVEKFKPARKQRQMTVGTLGRLVPEKNIHELLYAIKLLEKQVDIKLRIGGDGPDQPRLMKLAEKLELDVDFPGRIHDPVSFHQGLDVFVLASNREGLSISLQEAMSCGVVPVAVDSCGCRELVEDGVNGYLFKSGDRQMFSEKILEAINNKEAGAKARETIVKHFNSETATIQYLDLYASLGMSFKT